MTGVHIMKQSKTVLITGATSGVGFGVAKKLLQNGYDVYAVGRSMEVLEGLEKEGAHVLCAELQKLEGIEAVITFMPNPAFVILSAGVGTFAYTYEQDDASLQQMLDVNIRVPMQLTQRYLPMMMARKSGQFIFLGSQGGKVATPKSSVYAATKHALIGYTNALRMEVAPHNIIVTAIHPGPIDTPFLDKADKTGNYRTSLDKHLLSVDKVVNAVEKVVGKRVREVNLPWYMGISSKLYALAPALVEKLGRSFFMKK